MNMAQLSNAKALEEFENLFIYEKDYEDFFEDTYGTKNPDYNLYDLVAKYGIAKVVADFIKWQDSHKVKVGDVVPVVHAKWERVGSSSLIDPYRCSNCRKEPCKKQIEEYKTWGWDFTDYCPHCGAKMDLIKRSKVMTYGDKIRSMNDTELAEFLSSCVIPEDECKLMFIYGIGYLGFADDLEKKLGEQIKE